MHECSDAQLISLMFPARSLGFAVATRGRQCLFVGKFCQVVAAAFMAALCREYQRPVVFEVEWSAEESGRVLASLGFLYERGTSAPV